MFKQDGATYNAMARVLGREDSIDRFWKLVGDMRNAGFEMEFETFVKLYFFRNVITHSLCAICVWTL